MISMRDIFSRNVCQGMLEIKLPKKKLKVGVLAGKDERFRRGSAMCLKARNGPW